MKGKYLERMTWAEAEEAFNSKPILLIPLGARLKEHGYHLPLNNDWIIAEYLTKRVLASCDVLAAPTIQFNYFPAFVEYPGSVHINRETSQQMLDDIVMSFARHGVEKFYVLNTGVSTNWVLEPLRLALNQRGLLMDYFDLLGPLSKLKEEVAEQECGTHADEIETSMMLYMAPEIVNMERAVDEIQPKASGPLTRDPDKNAGLYSASGSWGRPTLATLEKGEVVVESFVQSILNQITELSSSSYCPGPPVKRYLP